MLLGLIWPELDPKHAWAALRTASRAGPADEQQLGGRQQSEARSPHFDGLGDDPRYHDLVRRMNFSD